MHSLAGMVSPSVVTATVAHMRYDNPLPSVSVCIAMRCIDEAVRHCIPATPRSAALASSLNLYSTPACTVAPSPSPMDASWLLSSLSSVVVVRTAVAWGTGVVVTPCGLVATCAHVVSGGAPLVGVVADGGDVQWFHAACVFVGSGLLDVALLSMPRGRRFRHAVGARRVARGDGVAVLGFPLILPHDGSATAGSVVASSPSPPSSLPPSLPPSPPPSLAPSQSPSPPSSTPSSTALSLSPSTTPSRRAVDGGGGEDRCVGPGAGCRVDADGSAGRAATGVHAWTPCIVSSGIVSGFVHMEVGCRVMHARVCGVVCCGVL
jgi:hypothetical protein